ncbi:Ig-like and fibronectin type-III domain-containing protein C25G4.10 [Dinothrombium tinctorium]|uniref:Ig-like and fibronectin type-III domain-containing protein C25G4.10 n=1 Tax=Dinothrombium tinctorium TaxID=1965070 RepID=A0A443RRT3_9ACAR|nr:Ig-like and fibronectin type-III domain-containing protein C25G4.10 [Dinothrombium tinctorium]
MRSVKKFSVKFDVYVQVNVKYPETFFVKTCEAAPSVDQISSEPIIVIPGDEALIDCLVNDAENYTVLWKYANSHIDIENATLLTANKIRLSDDNRYSVLHRTGSEVWILRIRNVNVDDSGVYVCEINSKPVQRVTRFVSVGYPEARNPLSHATPYVSKTDHNFTECCLKEQVSSACLPYCHIKNLVSMSMSTNVALTCFQNMKPMMKCLSDGRNHIPCCRQQNVPDVCLSACVGEYNLTTIYEHVTCLQYSAPILSCIAEGIETLPPPPVDVTAEPLSQNEIKVLWKAPKNLSLVQYYQLNVSELLNFDENDSLRKMDTSSKSKDYSSTKGSLKVSANRTEYYLKDLKPSTMYEIVMLSVNGVGKSVPSNTIRAFPLSSTAVKEKKDKSNKTALINKLPNLRQCCRNGGINDDKCLDILCDTSQPADTRNFDFISCIPYTNISFNCLSFSGVDKSECCRERGIPLFCQSLCKPIKSVDFRHLTCFHHFPAFLNCYLENYGILASEPRDVVVTGIHHNWALIKWSAPDYLANTVTKYGIYLKNAADHDMEYTKKAFATSSPFLIDNLKPGTKYEVFVTAVNTHGASRGSVRITFQTPQLPTSEVIDLMKDAPKGVYNETACCEKASMATDCLPLCNIHVKVIDAMNLGPFCVDTNSAHIMVRCIAGGRDHRPCCTRRGVIDSCLPLCTGLIDSTPLKVGARCGQYASSIFLCIKEGVETLPGMPVDFYASQITNSSIQLHWRKSAEDALKTNVSLTFQVRYEEIIGDTPIHPLQYRNTLNVTGESALLKNLLPATSYSIHVVAMNKYGSSLPSLVIVAQTSEVETKSVNITAKLGPPHAVEVIHQTYNSISLRWLPPLYVTPDSNLNYKVFYRTFFEDNWHTMDTFYNSVDITNLKPNTDYVIKVKAVAENGLQSYFSESILVFTDSLEAAVVNGPIITPKGPILEGSNIKIECTGKGSPTPVISILINGKVVKKAEGTRVVFDLAKVESDLSSISCYATNGVKNRAGQIAQESVDIVVKSKPRITAMKNKVQLRRYDRLVLWCSVSGVPTPKISWYRDFMGDVEILPSSNVEIITYRDKKKQETVNSTLIYSQVTKAEDGQYKCKAENEQGSDTAACTNSSFDVNHVLKSPNCIGKVNKLIACLHNGNDNRECCRQRDVPAQCLYLCSGIESDINFCLIGSINEIFSCLKNESDLTVNASREMSRKAIAKSTPSKSFMLAVVLFVTLLTLIGAIIFGSMLYYNKVYQKRNSTNNNNDDMIGFENQTYLKDTDSVTLSTRNSQQ